MCFRGKNTLFYFPCNTFLIKAGPGVEKDTYIPEKNQTDGNRFGGSQVRKGGEGERKGRKGKVPSSKEEEKRKMATHPPGHKKMCLLRIRAFSFLLPLNSVWREKERVCLFSLLSAQWAFSDRKKGRAMMMVLLFALRRSKSKEREDEGFANRVKNVRIWGYFWQFNCVSTVNFIDWNECVCVWHIFVFS